MDLTKEQQSLLKTWSSDPWLYLTGEDLDGRPIIWTVDERDDKTPVKPFPKDKVFLKRLVHELWNDNKVFIEKSRQMYISTICMLLIDWYCSFHEDREVVVSRVKESSAVKLINDKIRRTHDRKPEWLREYQAVNRRPAGVITYGCTGSTVTAVAQNFAHTDSRGITGSLVMVDEAAYQDYFPQIYQAVLPMSNRLWAVTTPHIGNPGAALFRQLIDEGRKELDTYDQKLHQEKGLKCRTTPRGIRVITLHWSADPARDNEWRDKEKVYYASEKDWRREQELDWTSAEGDVFYPEFGEIGREKFVAPAKELIKGPVYRSFDFGFRRPACTWFQYAPESDRVWVLREFMPHELGTHDFRDAVLYLSGQLDFGALNERAQFWIRNYEERDSGVGTPWFPMGTDYFDIGGPEAYRTEASAIRATEESNAAQVLANGGIIINMVDPPVKSRCDVIRRLLSVRPDGWPGIVFDPQCEELLQAFGGALAFETATKLKPIPVAPKKDGHFENLHDALGYGVVGVVPLDDRTANEEGQVLLGYRGRTPIFHSPGDGFNVYEGRT
jgi:hypothetical protein